MAKKIFELRPGRDSAIELSYAYESNGSRTIWDLSRRELKDLLILLKNSTGLLEEEQDNPVIDLDTGKHMLMAAKMNKGYLEMYQARLINWDGLVKGIMEMVKDIPGLDLKSYREWLDTQKDNKLPNKSSGSFMTALTDWDDIFPGYYEFQTWAVEEKLQYHYQELFR